MSNQPKIPPELPPTIQRVSSALRWAGTVGFWSQLALGVVSGLTLAFAGPNLTGDIEGSQGRVVGIFPAICGLVVLGISIYFSFRYIGIGNRLQTTDPAERPSRADTVRVIRSGLIVNLVGMLLTILSAEAIVGSLLAKALAQPQGGITTRDPSQYVRAIDIFIVQSSINTITAHFVGLAVALWLLYRVTK